MAPKAERETNERVQFNDPNWPVLELGAKGQLKKQES